MVNDLDKKILNLKAQGLSNRRIAAVAGVSRMTVARRLAAMKEPCDAVTRKETGKKQKRISVTAMERRIYQRVCRDLESLNQGCHRAIVLLSAWRILSHHAKRAAEQLPRAKMSLLTRRPQGLTTCLGRSRSFWKAEE